MKNKKGFTLVELVAAMGIMVVLLNAFAFMLEGGTAIIKKDKQKVKIVSFAQYFMQTMKSYGKNYYLLELNIKPPDDPSSPPSISSGYFYFNTNDELSKIIDSTNFENDITGKSPGEIFSGSMNDMLNNTKGQSYGAYFELSSSAIMGEDTTTSSGNIVLQGHEYVKIYINIVDLKSIDKDSSNIAFYIGR